MTKKKELTEQQEAFLDGLAKGLSPRAAIIEAGYAPNTTTKKVMEGVKDHIIDYMGLELAAQLGKAVNAIADQLDSPTPTGATQISAAREVFDRAGITKKEKMVVEHETPNGLFILPPKDKGDE